MIHLPNNNKGSDHIKLQKNYLKITSVNNNELISSTNIHNHLMVIDSILTHIDLDIKAAIMKLLTSKSK